MLSRRQGQQLVRLRLHRTVRREPRDPNHLAIQERDLTANELSCNVSARHQEAVVEFPLLRRNLELRSAHATSCDRIADAWRRHLDDRLPIPVLELEAWHSSNARPNDHRACRRNLIAPSPRPAMTSCVEANGGRAMVHDVDHDPRHVRTALNHCFGLDGR